MTKRKPAQLALDVGATPGTGRAERALNASVRLARVDGALEPVHAGAVTLARAVARALDGAERKRDPYAVAQLAREYRAILEALGLLPAGGRPTDALDDLLAQLATADPGPAPAVRDGTDPGPA